MIEVICSGFGGQGVLVAGMILADAGMEDNKQVSWYPSYGFEMRGGAANCDVKISDEEIPSPFCLEPDIVYTLNETAIDTYESRLKPGGVLLVNSSLVPDERTYRDDIQVIKVPATTIADELGNPKGTNIVMLGALACAPTCTTRPPCATPWSATSARRARSTPRTPSALTAAQTRPASSCNF